MTPPTSPLRDRLDDLVADVTAAPDAQAAWREGRRRRQAVPAAVAAAALVVAVVLAVAVVPLRLGASPTLPASVPALAPRYPQRIAALQWVRDLPRAPGPMAAVARVDAPDHRTRTNAVDGALWDYEVLAADGTRYRLDVGSQAVPALSPDGRRLAYAVGDAVHVHDLVSGTDTVVTGTRARDVLWGKAARLRWSPSGTRLLLTGSTAFYVVDGTRAHTLAVGDYAGWFDDDTLGRVRHTFVARTQEEVTTLVRVDATTGRAGAGVEVARYPIERPYPEPRYDLSPDGSRVTADGPGYVDTVGPGDDVPGATSTGRQTVQVLDARTGQPLTDTVPTGVVGQDPPPPTWLGSTPAFWTDAGLVPAGSTSPRVVADVHVLHLQIAGDSPGPAPSWLGTRTAWITWWWRESILGLLAATLAAWGLRNLLRRKASRRITSWPPA